MSSRDIDEQIPLLSNGQRIIEADSVNALLEAMANGTEVNPGDLDAFARWQRGDYTTSRKGDNTNE